MQIIISNIMSYFAPRCLKNTDYSETLLVYFHLLNKLSGLFFLISVQVQFIIEYLI